MLISKKKLLILEDIAKMKTLTPIQKEIVTALEQMKEKALITEANLAKKVRKNAKISGKNKAGICLKDCNRQSKPKFTQRKTIQLQDSFSFNHSSTRREAGTA